MTNKEKYYSFCEVDKYVPIFSQSWWLDTVSENEWDVALVEKNGKIIASLPYFIKNNLCCKIITMPKLTKYMGPYIKYPSDQKYETKLSYEKTVMVELIDQLPKFDKFSQNFNYSVSNWLPFYWKNFNQTTYYTYIINDISDANESISKFNYSKKKNIAKAEEDINIVYDISDREFYDNHKMILAKQGEKISYDYSLFSKICSVAYKYNSARILAAYDEKGALHAAYFIVWDGISMYNLISTIDPDYRFSGASTLLIKEMIIFASSFLDKIDLAGSMIQSVEHSFRKFGAIQTPYSHITKTSSKFYKFNNILKEILFYK